MSVYETSSTITGEIFARPNQVEPTSRNPENNVKFISYKYLLTQPDDVIKSVRLMGDKEHNTIYYRIKNGSLERSDHKMCEWRTQEV
ncbi:TPA: hypothetical protein ACX6QH_003665 [Photobacterium damselae]|uniref:hypothetical protein n=1 Tax=Photobacterium damselae TaxID=38293 RepID=UPI002090D8E8|nr:hypothetical protein [Photobacterium damselae]USR77788.1 hypothetical protein NGM67_08355 [Photobacterium damselae]